MSDEHTAPGDVGQGRPFESGEEASDVPAAKPEPWKFRNLRRCGRPAILLLWAYGMVIFFGLEFFEGLPTLIVLGVPAVPVAGVAFYEVIGYREQVVVDPSETTVTRETEHSGFGSRRSTIFLPDIRAIVEVSKRDHPFRKHPRLIIVDNEGEIHDFPAEAFQSRRLFAQFCDTVRSVLTDRGALEAARAAGAREQQRAETYRSRKFPVSIGAVVAVLAAFVAQSTALSAPESGRFRSRLFSELHLVDGGGLFGEALMAGDWFRLMTASLLHGHIFEVLTLGVLVFVTGLSLERYIGGWRTVVILIVGSMVGNACALFVSDPNVIVGAWGGAYAMVGAWCLLYGLYRSELTVLEQASGLGTYFIALVALGGAWAVLPFVPTAQFFAVLLGGVLSGALMTLGLLSDTSRLEPKTPRRVQVLTGAVALVFAAGLVAGVHNFMRGDLQSDRLLWVHQAVDSFDEDASREQEDFFNSLFSMTENLDDAYRREVVREAIEALDVDRLPISPAHSDRLYRRDGEKCILDESEEALWHQMYLDALPTASLERYMDTIAWECEQD